MTPKFIVDQIARLSDEYFKYSIEMGEIAERSGVAWLETRKTCPTNAETDKVWSGTADGRREAYLKWYLRGLEKKRGALILQLRMMEGEAKSQW